MENYEDADDVRLQYHSLHSWTTSYTDDHSSFTPPKFCKRCKENVTICYCSCPCILHGEGGGDIHWCKKVERRCGLKEAILALQKKCLEAAKNNHTEAVKYFDKELTRLTTIPCKTCQKVHKDCIC